MTTEITKKIAACSKCGQERRKIRQTTEGKKRDLKKAARASAQP